MLTPPWINQNTPDSRFCSRCRRPALRRRVARRRRRRHLEPSAGGPSSAPPASFCSFRCRPKEPPSSMATLALPRPLHIKIQISISNCILKKTFVVISDRDARGFSFPKDLKFVVYSGCPEYRSSPRSWQCQIGAGFVSRGFCLIGTHPPTRRGFQSRFFGVLCIAPPPILAVTDRGRLC